MAIEPIDPVNEHGQLRARDLRRAAELAYAHDQAGSSGDLGGFDTGGGRQTHDNTAKRKLIKLTARAGAAYAWTEMIDNGVGVPTVAPNGESGTTTEIPAWEISGRLTVPVDGSTVVWAYPAQDGMSLLFLYAVASGGGDTGDPLDVATSCDGGTLQFTTILATLAP